jgi:CBS domain containing-hemolysin-like protein
MDVLIPLLIMLLLLICNGLCVGSDFALIGSPRHRLDTQAASGDKRAARVVEILNNPQRQDRFIATAQLGITVASLALGMYGERTLAEWLTWPAKRLQLGPGRPTRPLLS